MDEESVLAFVVTSEEAGLRADTAIARAAGLSRAVAARLAESGAVTCGGVPLTKKQIVREGDEIRILLPEPECAEAEPEDIPLDIVYEDGDVIVVNKPKGMVVHPAPGHERGTLVSALLWHSGDSLSGIGGVMRPGIVHRIDRDTTGLIAAAKNDAAHQALAAQLAAHTMYREYQALVIGTVPAEGTVDAPIGRSRTDRKKMAVLPAGAAGAREARTHYTLLEGFGAFSYVRLVLETGRTHQIRVHMSSIGHPVMGDETYGANRTPFERRHAALLEGQCLHAGALHFTHPRTGEPIHLTAPLPAPFERLLTLLRGGEESR